MGRRPARHARMHIFTRIGVFRLLGTAFGTTAWHELSTKFERKYQTDTCDGEGDDSTAKEQESARSKLFLELVLQEIDEIPPEDAGFKGFGTKEQAEQGIPIYYTRAYRRIRASSSLCSPHKSLLGIFLFHCSKTLKTCIPGWNSSISCGTSCRTNLERADSCSFAVESSPSPSH